MSYEIFKKVLLVLGIMSYPCKWLTLGEEITRPRSFYHKYRGEIIDTEAEIGLEALAICVQRITDRSFLKHIAIFWQPNFPQHRIILDSYLTKIHRDVFLHDYRSPGEQIFGHKSVKNFLMFKQDLGFLNETEKIFHHENVDKRGKFVMCLSVFSWTEDILLQISKYLWKFKIANAVLVVYDGGKNSVKIFGYWPFSENGCAPTTIRLLVNDCNNEIFTTDNIFARKMRNMHECPIKGSTVTIGNAVTVFEEGNVRKVKGFEGILFNTLAEFLNFTPVILPPPSSLWGIELPNGTWTGIHGLIKNGAADVAFGQMIALKLRFEDYTVSISTNSIVWILPNASPLNWQKLMLPLQPTVWTFLIMTIVSALVFTILEAVYSNIHPRLLTLWGIFFAQGVDNSYENYAMKFFIVMWIFFSYILTNAYLGSLVSFLTAVIVPKNYETTRELLDNNFPFGAVEGIRDFYNNPDDPLDYEIFKKCEVLDFSELYEKRLKVIYAETKLAVPSLRAAVELMQRDGHFHIMKEHIMTYPTVFAMPRDSPYITEFNIQMRRLQEAGIIRHWISRNLTKQETSASPGRTVLRMIHLLGIFSLWLIGISVSAIAFVCESLHKWHKSRKNSETRRKTGEIDSNIRSCRKY